MGDDVSLREAGEREEREKGGGVRVRAAKPATAAGFDRVHSDGCSNTQLLATSRATGLRMPGAQPSAQLVHGFAPRFGRFCMHRQLLASCSSSYPSGQPSGTAAKHVVAFAASTLHSGRMGGGRQQTNLVWL
eukprot:366371-Chlamydomonas_euryale.AAC.12